MDLPECSRSGTIATPISNHIRRTENGCHPRIYNGGEDTFGIFTVEYSDGIAYPETLS